MEEIKPEYLTLFNAITDAEKKLNEIIITMMKAQQSAEEIYIGRQE